MDRGRVAALVGLAALTCGAKNEAATDVTVGVGAGQYEYMAPSGGCSSVHARATEVATFAAVRHQWEGHLVASGEVTFAPAEAVVEDGGQHPSAPAMFALSGRIGGDWSAFGVLAGPQLFVHPEIGRAVLVPSLDLRIGPRSIYAWGRLLPQPAQSIAPLATTAGLGTAGPLGTAELGVAPPYEGRWGLIGRGMAPVAPGWRLGGEAGFHDVYGAFSGLDWRAMVLLTHRLPPRHARD